LDWVFLRKITTYLSVSSVAVRPPLPFITSRKLDHIPPNRPAKQAWLETLGTIEDEKLGLVDLHPDIFATFPRYYV
jgi:large subunit ribosomal protein L4